VTWDMLEAIDGWQWLTAVAIWVVTLLFVGGALGAAQGQRGRPALGALRTL
jgi:hypothetical protein